MFSRSHAPWRHLVCSCGVCQSDLRPWGMGRYLVFFPSPPPPHSLWSCADLLQHGLAVMLQYQQESPRAATTWVKVPRYQLLNREQGLVPFSVSRCACVGYCARRTVRCLSFCSAGHRWALQAKPELMLAPQPSLLRVTWKSQVCSPPTLVRSESQHYKTLWRMYVQIEVDCFTQPQLLFGNWRMD